MAIELGDTVRDSITGYEGIVIGVTSWIYGCRRLTVQTKGLHDGKPIEAISIDEPQCVLLTAKEPPIQLAETGGPRPKPTRRSSATRR